MARGARCAGAARRQRADRRLHQGRRGERARTDAGDLGGRERIGARHDGCVRADRAARSSMRSAQGGFDAIYLDLHGAMVTEHLDDGEGEIARTRAPDRRRSTCRSSCRSIFMRTSPRACSNTRARSSRTARIRTSIWRRPASAPRGFSNAWCPKAAPVASRDAPRPVPDSGERHVHARRSRRATCTACWRRSKKEPVVSVSFAPGFPAADFPECGPTIWAYSFDQASRRTRGRCTVSRSSSTTKRAGTCRS